MANRIQNIAIIGAAGNIGKRITTSLLETNKHNVTALTRAESKASMPSGVQVAKVDYTSHSSIVSALKGQEALVITLSISAPHDQGSKIIAAAAEAGVKWIMPNQWGPDYAGDKSLGKDVMNFGERHAAIRKEIESKGMVWTALVCNHWYEFSLALGESTYGFDFKSKTLTLNDDGETKINHSTWAQCGRAVASFFSLKLQPEGEDDSSATMSQFRNQPLYISSFLLSQKDILASVLRVTGQKETDWTINQQPASERFHTGLERLQKGDRMGFTLAMYARIFYKEGHPGDYESKLANDVLGLPKEDVDEATRTAIRISETGEGLYN